MLVNKEYGDREGPVKLLIKKIELKKGETYYCTCGKSTNQPFVMELMTHLNKNTHYRIYNEYFSFAYKYIMSKRTINKIPIESLHFAIS